MTNENMTATLNRIGAMIADELGSEADGAFLYAEAGEQWQAAGLFTDQGNHVASHATDDSLFEAIGDLWDATEADKKWSVMQYTISEGKFDADFSFPDEVDPGESGLERQTRAVAARFGDKPVHYPPQNFEERFTLNK